MPGREILFSRPDKKLLRRKRFVFLGETFCQFAARFLVQRRRCNETPSLRLAPLILTDV
jgi:hypothetical protein